LARIQVYLAREKGVTSSDLVLGTSTIDVGVDFKINFLIFESESAGSFIQRLGRRDGMMAMNGMGSKLGLRYCLCTYP